MSIKSSIARRCKIATDCLPESPFRAQLESLHDEMLRFVNRKSSASSTATLQQALEALTHIETCIHGHEEIRLRAINALRAALAAQPQALDEAMEWMAKGYEDGYRTASANGPAWHDAPNAPGLWVAKDGRAFNITTDLLHYPWGEFQRRWFGPITPDSGETE